MVTYELLLIRYVTYVLLLIRYVTYVMPKDDILDELTLALEELEKIEETEKLERSLTDRILTNKGYRLNKSQLGKSLKGIKRELTVRPIVMGVDFGLPPEKFSIYIETERHLYVPKFYGINKFGPPIKDELSAGEPINVNFNGNLKPHQLVPVSKCIEAFNTSGGGMLSMGCGTGKCFAPGTKIMMADYSIEIVEKLRIGDRIMGDDGEPRTIVQLGNGRDDMYQIYDKRSRKSYRVNSEHILCFRKRNSKHIVEITVQNYFCLSNRESAELYGYRGKIVLFPEIYMNTTENENKILNEFYDYLQLVDDEGAKKLLLRLSERDIYRVFIKYVEFLFNNLVQGLMPKTETIFALVGIVLDKSIINDEKFIINREIWNENTKQLYNISNSIYEFIELTDSTDNDLFPVTITSCGYGEYYGFVLEGNNHRFMLADGIVTHNTVCALNLITQMKRKTLVVVNREFLLSQWVERIEQFTNARIGIVQGKKCEIEDKDILVGMLHTLSSRAFEPGTFDSIGMVVIDEAHHISTKVFSRCLHQITTKYMLGLSATPKRKDGLNIVFDYFIGPMIYQIKSENPNIVKVQIASMRSNSEYYAPLKIASYNSSGKQPYNIAGMINNLAEFELRTRFLCKKIIEFAQEDRCILVLSDRRDHLKAMMTIVETSGFLCGLYVGAMKQTELKKSEEAQILFATFGLVEEAFDLPKLNTLVFASPRTSIEQAVGRILRKQHEVQPIIFDLADQFAGFTNQSNTRRRYYKKKEYEIWDSNFYDGEQQTDWIKQEGNRRKKLVLEGDTCSRKKDISEIEAAELEAEIMGEHNIELDNVLAGKPKKSKKKTTRNSLMDIAIAKATLASNKEEEKAIEKSLKKVPLFKKESSKFYGGGSSSKGKTFKQSKITNFKHEECALQLSD